MRQWIGAHSLTNWGWPAKHASNSRERYITSWIAATGARRSLAIAHPGSGSFSRHARGIATATLRVGGTARARGSLARNEVYCSCRQGKASRQPSGVR